MKKYIQPALKIRTVQLVHMLALSDPDQRHDETTDKAQLSNGRHNSIWDYSNDY